MKTKILLLFLLGWMEIIWGQNLINESRMLNGPTDLHQYEASSISKKSASTISVYGNSKFTIVGEEGEYYKIYFWDWEKDSPDYNKYNFNTTTDAQRYFLIEKKLIDVSSVKIYNRIAPAWGTFVYPFKWRPNDGTFEPTFALAIAGGIKFNPWRINKHVFSALLGVGPSSVSLDKYNTTVLDKPLDNKISVAAVTFSLNLMYQYEFVQFGVSAGIDNIFDSNIYNWKNQGKPWLTFGVGISIFKDNEKTASPTSNP
ncbi:MAG: hypothetical protein ACN6OB_13090 [Chryseobacterium jejuense]|uniref:hypothetical protein n=1 Tax=Chryseobacterium jejuense TaxID=445960 RepID=UPI003D0FBF14